MELCVLYLLLEQKDKKDRVIIYYWR